MVDPKYFNKLKDINKKVVAIVDGKKASISSNKAGMQTNNDDNEQ